MELSKNFIRKIFTAQDFYRGEQYYREDRVKSLYADESNDELHIEAVVHGSRDYTVTVNTEDNVLKCKCECPRFHDGYFCKHLAAVFLDFIDNYQGKTAFSPEKAYHTDFYGVSLLEYYNKRTDEPLEDTFRLEPNIHFPEEDYPLFGLSVGREKMYVVRNIDEFAGHVVRRETYAYGKNLSFCHAIENFDPLSQKLIRFIIDEFPKFRSSKTDSYINEYYRPGGDKRYIRFDGDNFERVFELFKSNEAKAQWKKQKYEFREADPKIEITLKAFENGAMLDIEGHKPFMFFGNGFHLYASTEYMILRCSRDFQEKVYPIIKTCGRKGGFFAEADIPTLCDGILSQAAELVTIKDDDRIISKYTPDECIACYYFDTNKKYALTTKVRYRYGDKYIDDKSSQDELKGIKRNIRLERRLNQPLERYFDYDEFKNRFYIEDEGRALDFLTDAIAEFQKSGEVYLSDALKRKRVSTAKRPVVGISVSGGELTLILETGEFPPEELEELYNSLIKKRKYYKLKDGRYLPLEGSGYERIAELAHMTQLDAKQLRAGEAVMPAYRGLYLDCLLERSETVSVDKNDAFRRLIRDFKSVENSDFTVPAGFCGELRPYQKTGFQWLKTLEANGFGGILADEMGLGKTIQLLAFLLTANRREKGMPSLIVCPTSLILNWYDETKRFAPSLAPLLIMGSAAERKKQLENDTGADVLITSYDLLKRDIELYEGRKFYCCILDEGQNIKNQNTLASKAVKRINCVQRFVMTGTPIENRLSELWNLFDFLMPGYLFSHSTFLTKLEKPIINSGDAAAQRQLSLLVQPFMLRRLKKDVLKELPPKIEHIRRIHLTEEERKVYDAEKYAARKQAEETDEKFKILALLTYLRRICCDPALCFENYTGKSSKLDACMELCVSQTENGHQVLLFSQFTSMLDRIRARLNEACISNYTIQGSTPKEERARLVKAFGRGEAKVFLISLKAGGTGLNLTSADVIIHYDPWWNIAAQNQATDRAHRIGQMHSVQVYKLIAEDTVEERILHIQEKKAALMDMVTAEQTGAPLTKEEILALLS